MTDSILFNPGQDLLWKRNALVSGRARRHAVRHYEGPLSIKSVWRGSATWATAEHRAKIDPGTFLVLAEGTAYDLEIEGVELCETFCLFLRPGYLDEVESSRLMSVRDMLDHRPIRAAIPNTGVWIKDGPIADRMSALRDLHRSGRLAEVDGEDGFRRVVECLLAPATQEAATGGSIRDELKTRLDRARHFMLDAYREPLDLTRIASEAFLSPQHFHELFARTHGETPYRFLTRRRLTQAKLLLQNTSESVEAVASRAGYESASSFSRAFLRHHGVRPGEIRRMDIEERHAPP